MSAENNKVSKLYIIYNKHLYIISFYLIRNQYQTHQNLPLIPASIIAHPVFMWFQRWESFACKTDFSWSTQKRIIAMRCSKANAFAFLSQNNRSLSASLSTPRNAPVVFFFLLLTATTTISPAIIPVLTLRYRFPLAEWDG